MLNKDEVDAIIKKMFEIWYKQNKNWVGSVKYTHLWAYKGQRDGLLHVIISNMKDEKYFGIQPELTFYHKKTDFWRKTTKYYVRIVASLQFVDRNNYSRIGEINQECEISQKVYDNVVNYFEQFEKDSEHDYYIRKQRTEQQELKNFLS